jgi:cell wall-associated NlpC family hydrolase
LLATVLDSSGRVGILLAVTLLIGLIGSMLTPAPPASAAVSMAAARRTQALHEAASLKGRPYHYGATGPRAFDCSGYTRYVMAHVGKHLPRTSRQQYAASRKIARGAARPGDLVFFKSRGRVTHVALYAGGHQVWHAPHSGARVRKERIWTGHWSAGRVLPVA